MKIDSPKFAPAPRTAERPQLSTTTTKSGNTGIVPTAAQPKPADTFERAGTGGTSANTGIVPTNLQKTQSISTYSLPAHLEAHRATFDRYGEHIAKLPSHVQPGAIERATDHLYRDLGDIATRDEIGKGLSEAVAFYSRGTTANDPQCYRVAVPLDGAPDAGSARGTARDFGTSITRAPSSRTAGNTLRSVRQQPQEDTFQQHRPRLHRRHF
jgi:hypothetical protein